MIFSLFSPYAEAANTAHDFLFQSIDGEYLPMSDFKGKPILVVNTASMCGFTKQYDGLQEVYNEYRDQGFVVLGIPSNNFGSQEPGTEKEIKKFCETNFGITFPMTEKVSVKGDDIHPFYAWIRSEGFGLPKWNFHKYIIGKDGEIIDSFGSMTKPTSKKIKKIIEAELQKPNVQN
ncbi:MAG: glutathione peroxidase [Pseudomonadota bacterium]